MKPLTRLGIALTVCYLLGFFYLLTSRWSEVQALDLNALGDFFAGASGPLAFMWLVAGYFLQDHFVRQTIEQQQEATRHQLDVINQQYAAFGLIQRQAAIAEHTFQLQRQEADRALDPVFIFSSVSCEYPEKSGRYGCSVKVSNEGAPVTKVGVLPGLLRITGPHFPRSSWISGDVLTVAFDLPPVDEATVSEFTLSFTRLDGSFRMKTFVLRVFPTSPQKLAEGYRHEVAINAKEAELALAAQPQEN